MAWTIEYAGSVQKSVRRLDRQVQRRIRDFLETRLAGMEDPRRIGLPLHGKPHQNLWRYRVGDYRIIAQINDRNIRILIVRIAHRRHAYNL